MRIPVFFAKRFIAGETIEDALKIIETYNSKNILVTIDYLGGIVKEKKRAKQVTQKYLEILEKIGAENYGTSISIKLSQLGLLIDKQFALENVTIIVKKAKQLGLLVEIDMESSKRVQDTIDLYNLLVKKYPNITITIQAYLSRSEKDVRDIIAKNGKIRLVKGVYKEEKSVIIQEEDLVIENFIKLTKLCLDKSSLVKIATHDDKIIEKAKEYIEEKNISKNRFEFEFLYGVKPSLPEKIIESGYTARVYLPFGENWFHYFIRRLIEGRTSLASILRTILRS